MANPIINAITTLMNQASPNLAKGQSQTAPVIPPERGLERILTPPPHQRNDPFRINRGGPHNPLALEEEGQGEGETAVAVHTVAVPKNGGSVPLPLSPR